MEEYSKHRLYYLFSFVAVLWQIMDSAKLMANPLKRHFRIAYSWLSSHSFAKIKPFNKTYCLVKWQKIEFFNYSFAIFKFIKSHLINDSLWLAALKSHYAQLSDKAVFSIV